MNFTTTVQQYDDTQDLFIEIPHYILQHLTWEEGDELAWSIKANQIILTKIKDSSSIKEEHGEVNDKIEELTEHFFQDYDEVYDDYIQATNEETYGDQSNELPQDRTLPPPQHFPHFP